MDDIITPGSIRHTIMSWIAGSTGPFENSTAHLWKNDGVIVGENTPLSAFSESTFQGYAPLAGQSPIGVFTDTAGVWRAKFDSMEWDTVNGISQVISNALAGTITMAGTVIVTVTAAGMTGSPHAVTVNVLLSDTASMVAAKAVTALNADADVGAFFVASASGSTVTLTAITGAANDATMNAAYADGTATGLTASPTSTQVTPGAAPVAINETAFGVYFTDSTGTQYRGAALFAEPFALTAPFQAVTTWPDLPYGG